jgi:hypothetical protein
MIHAASGVDYDVADSNPSAIRGSYWRRTPHGTSRR